MILINYLLNPLIIGDTPYHFELSSGQEIMCFVVALIGFIGCLALTALGIVKFINEKESSGEYAGKAVGRDVFQEIIFHTGFVVVAINLALVSSESILGVFSVFYSISQFLITIAIYFALSLFATQLIG